MLSWQPVLSEIAGVRRTWLQHRPYEYREKPDAKPVGYGEFFFVWKKQADGNWKVVLDQGVEHSTLNTEIKLEAIVPQSKAADSKNDDLSTLMQIDRKFSQLSKDQGIQKAFAQFLAQKTRLMRPHYYQNQTVKRDSL